MSFINSQSSTIAPSFSSAAATPTPLLPFSSTQTSSSSSSSSSWQTAGLTQSAISKVFNAKALFDSVHSYLGLREVARCARVSKTWDGRFSTELPEASSIPQHLRLIQRRALIAYHKNRKDLSLKRDGLDLQQAFKLPRGFRSDALFLTSPPIHFTADSWRTLFAHAEGRFPHLTSLDLSTHEAAAIIPHLSADALPVLTRLNLASCSSLNTATLALLTRNLPQLTDLDLSACSPVNEAIIKTIAAGCPNLTHLRLNSCIISEATIRFIATAYPRLLTLSLGDSVVDEAGIHALTVGWGNLTELSLHNPLGSLKIHETALSAIAAGCPNLVKLDLEGCLGVTEVSLREITTKCPRLADLHLGDCRELNEGALRVIAEQGHNLKNLILRGAPTVNYATIRPIITNCSQLTSLNLGRCNQISPEEISALRSEFPRVLIIHWHCRYTE